MSVDQRGHERLHNSVDFYELKELPVVVQILEAAIDRAKCEKDGTAVVLFSPFKPSFVVVGGTRHEVRTRLSAMLQVWPDGRAQISNVKGVG